MLLHGSSAANRVLILAHGAGAPMDTPFMNFFAKSLAGPDLRVARFEFPYMKFHHLKEFVIILHLLGILKDASRGSRGWIP